MIHPVLRIASAVAAFAAFLGGIAAIVIFGGSFLFALLILFAGVMAVPAMFGGAPPMEDDLPRIGEQFRRFRAAMLGCFAAAWLMYAIAAIEHVERLASLGVAFWLIAFVLLFFVVYYRAQLRLARATN